MYFSVFAVATGLVGLVVAQNGLPTCAQPCVTQFTTGSTIGGCSNLDIKCICSSSTFLPAIACCLVSSCSAADQALAVAYAKDLCTTAGVTVADSATSLCPNGVPIVSSGGTATATSAASAGAASGSAAASGASATTASSRASTTTGLSSSAAAASATTAGGAQNIVGGGVSVAGGLAALFALM